MTFECLAKAGFEDDFVKFYNEHIGTACDGSGLGLKFEDEYGELTLCNGIVKTEDGVVSCTIDIRVPVTLKGDEVRKMCEDRLEDENGRIEIHMIGDSLFFPRESPLVNALYKAYVDVTGRYRKQTNGNRWWNLCEVTQEHYSIRTGNAGN